MAFQQQKMREIVFQILYSFDIGKASPEDMVPLLMKELAVTKKTVRQALEVAQNISAKLRDIDATIRKTSQSYNFERIQNVEKNILRLGIYEMLYDDNIPPKVAIAEAMRLSRKFSTPESASFINAILDNIYKISLGESVDTKQIASSVEALVESENIANEAARSAKKNEEENDEDDDEE